MTVTMATTDSGRARQAMDPRQAMRLGGAILLFGVLLTVITIGFEIRIGWATRDEQATIADTAAFLQAYWDSLRWLWAGQMVGTCLRGLSALVLLQALHLQSRWLSTSVLWFVVFICAILVAVAQGLALGSFPPALAAFEQSPEVFETIRTGVRFLYAQAGLVAWLAFLVLFAWEGFAKRGVLPRSWLVGTAVAFVLAIGVAVAGLLPPRAVGVVAFLPPGLLGLAFWRAGRRAGDSA